ncbi:2OG-Fe(II) oxygenase [Trichocoleus sp. FACHB-591]|uniref:2OG-Fe(II) oxygenase n=1 Tax=Trichocoleus sp. FACHB-591 TaxID=2692872 RepID=UPI0016886CC4|nr:2OG-Fe(II) oxygenase [Trichocoleus sp. FACHB-591]MBD2093699.1 2OG-Fe(II) oxygenase [Trichocoleus sp. FACHB-591]
MNFTPQQASAEGFIVPTTGSATARANVIVPANYLRIKDFLPIEERDQLFKYVLQQEPNFVAAGVQAADLTYRQAKVLYSFPQFADTMTSLVELLLPDVLSQLGLPLFPISQIEAQLTAYNDGNYYITHNDKDSPESASRQISYIYYLHRKPKLFSGGELRIYDCKSEENKFVVADSFQTIEPIDNSIVFFQSGYAHEILPVRCPSQVFADSRFTLNGWVRSES